MKKNNAPFNVSGVYQKNYFEKDFSKYTSKFLHETSKSTSLAEYIVLFDSIFQIEDMYQAFYRHLHFEYCPESMDFVSDLEKFFKESQKSTKSLPGLIEKYIKNGAESELNLSHQAKQELMEVLKDQLSLDEWKLKETPEKVFYSIRNAILLQIRTSTFPRFVRTNLCQLVVEKLKFDPKVVTLKINVDYPYSDEDYAFEVLTDKDIHFSRSMLQDSFEWAIVSSTPTLNSFWSTKAYMKDVKLFETQPCVAKYEMILPFSIQRCAATFISTRECEKYESITNRVTIENEYDHETCKKLMKEKGYEFDESQKRWCYIINWDVSFPFPITTPRRQHGTLSIDYDPATQTLIKVIRSVVTTKSEEKSKRKVYLSKTAKEPVEKDIYLTISIRVDCLQRVDDYRCLYKQIILYGPHGYANSPFLQKLTIQSISKKLEKELYDYLKTKKEDTWEDVYKSLKGDPVGRMLEEIDIPKKDYEYKEREANDLIEKIETLEEKRSKNQQ